MIYRVPTNQVSDIWPEVEGLLRPVIDLPACRCTLAGTYLKLRTGQRQLFVATEQGTIVAAGVTCITSYDTGDWVTIILTAAPEEALASDVAGYAYTPGGVGRGQPEPAAAVRI